MTIEDNSKFKPLPRHAIRGEINAHYAYTDDSGEVLLKRVPLSDADVETIIEKENDRWGLSDVGVKLIQRSPDEQAEFERTAAEQGLLVLPSVVDSSEESYRKFLEKAVTLDEYLQHAKREEADQVLETLFEDIIHAHRLGIVYGDRWPKNILVDPAMGPVNIDFDIRIEGPAKELELAQVLFYTLAFYPTGAVSLLGPILERLTLEYDLGIVKKLVMHKASIPDDRYKNVSATVEALFAGLITKGTL